MVYYFGLTAEKQILGNKFYTLFITISNILALHLYLFRPSIVSKAGKALLMSQQKKNWRRAGSCYITCCTLN